MSRIVNRKLTIIGTLLWWTTPLFHTVLGSPSDYTQHLLSLRFYAPW